MAWVIKRTTRSFIMLNTILENSEKHFPYTSILFYQIMVAEHGTYDYDLMKEIKVIVKLLLLFSFIVLTMIKVVVIIQVKAGNTMIKYLK